MKKTFVRILIPITIILTIILIVPLLVKPVPAGKVESGIDLADPDSLFVDLDGINVHYKMIGSGEPVMIFLHGFGSNVYSWEKVMGPLSDLGTVVAYDWVGFGLTSRPLSGSWREVNPYSTRGQIEVLIDLMDHLEIKKAILIGNSAGALIASETAITHPDRVSGLVLVDPALDGAQFPSIIKWIINTPQMDGIGPLLSRQITVRGDEFIRLAWHDPALITEETFSAYRKPLEIIGWDYGLWEFTRAEKTNVSSKIDLIDQTVLVVTGDDDRIVPTESSIELAGRIPEAKLVVIANAGHVPQEEKPEEFIRIIINFVRDMGYKGSG